MSSLDDHLTNLIPGTIPQVLSDDDVTSVADVLYGH